MKKYALFFDLDGTLWDALSQIKDSYNLTMKNNNLPYRFTLKMVQGIMGLTPLETVKVFFKEDLNEKEGLSLFKKMFLDELQYLKKHPGILYQDEIEILKELNKKYDLFIVSNADKGYIETYLNSHKDLPLLFKDHLCAGDTLLDKKDNILLLKSKYNIDEVIYIGDTNKDKIESEKANVKFIHASYGFGKIEEKVNSISSLNELPILVDKLFN